MAWLPLLLGLLGLLVLVAVEFYVVHRTVSPSALGDRLSHLIMMILAPPVAIRAGDSVSRDLFNDFHPLAVAQVVCPEPKFVAFARRILRDAKFPIVPICPTGEPASRETERWFRTRLSSVLIGLVRRAGTDPEDLFAPPEPDGHDCRLYCPRCESQYTLPKGECFACGGIPLKSFEQNKPNQRGLNHESP